MNNREELKNIATSLETLAKTLKSIVTIGATDDPWLKCGSSRCAAYAGNGRCKNTEKCTASTEPAEELLQGYTLEQWATIRKGGYLCEFTGHGGVYPANGPVQRLIGINKLRPASFRCDTGAVYSSCRPAQIPGVLRPWFGGDCPVADDTRVLIKFDNGHAGIVNANARLWSWNNSAQSDIIAYMGV